MRLPRSPAPFAGRLVLAVGALALAGLALAVGGSGLAAAPSGAQTSQTTNPATNGGNQPSLSQLAPGLEIVDGAITGSGPEAGRTLNSSQATAFVQAWLPDSVFGTPSFEEPPTALPVYEVQVDYKYQGVDGSMTINYASDGTSAWVSMPPQNLWPGVVVTEQRWIRAPDRTVAGFEGQLTPEPVPTAPPITETAAGSSASTSSSSSWVPALVVGGLVILVGAGALVAVRRRRAASGR